MICIIQFFFANEIKADMRFRNKEVKEIKAIN